ncbi:MAG: MBL fold metallo-hydrolase [Betaproteobacteria bacterium]|nr:MBL fold metallo-hydrolase [Betaproteobacteria bacterium]NBY08397.1 MBL fold metallo-hydrolase [Betaproteobacteria bacterium]
MNLLVQELQYPHGDTLARKDQILEVAPGVYWIRMGLPFSLDHINLWLLRDEIDGVQGWTAVDCCIDAPSSREQWEFIFAHLLENKPILRVVVTHMHPDHIGLAHWLCERWKAPLWISYSDFYMARVQVMNTEGHGGEAVANFFLSHGLDNPQTIQEIRNRHHYFKNLVPSVPRQMHRLMDGQTIKIGAHYWQCISGYGHAPEHMALSCSSLNVLISGDMILPRITTNISVFEFEPESNPLQLFLDSLLKYLPLHQDTLVLPSHGRPFVGIHRRIEQLQEHHAERLAEVMSACTQKPCHAKEIMDIMFPRKLDTHQTTFALGESIAHIHMLWRQGQLTRHKNDQGVYLFSASVGSTRP